MKRVGIIGRPVAHSLSPVFQGAAFAACGLDVRYEKWDTTNDALAGRLVSLRDPSILGANVTIPHKEHVLPMLDELGGQSARMGAVNTIVNRDGRLFGFNTDGPGFVAALRNEVAFEPGGKRFLLLGAGGAARGIAFALAEARAAHIAISNRSGARAERLASEVRAAGANVSVLPPTPALALLAPLLPRSREKGSGDEGLPRSRGKGLADEGPDCIVNCTSIGMHGGPDPVGLPCDLTQFGPRTLVVDIVYAPEETPLLRAAAAAGLRTLGGLPMLIYQGALAFELWTGVHAPVDVMFEAARKVLKERRS